MPLGLLREWLCNVLDREGDCVYCCALVLTCIVGTVCGEEYEDACGGLEPPAGWSAPGTVELAFEGTTLEA